MKLSFDKFERYELPQVTLCNPNSRATEVDGKITITDTVGVLSNPKGMNLKLNFNAPHELSFDYYRHKSTDPIKQSFYDKIFEAIQTDRYVYLTDIGYFIISNVSDSDEDNVDKTSISLKSCEENEFAVAEGLYLKEGTYYLHTNNNDGLLDLFLPKTAGWTMGYIDPSLLTKPYYVEDTEVDNGYNFLYTTIQNMFECIVEPDIVKRTISVYSRVYYAGHHLTDIHIAKYNLLKHRNIEENDEDKYTALNVQGKDENLEIRAVNPTGKNVIYNFEPRYAWMSPALQDAVTRWQKKCESVEEEYLTLQQGYYAELETLFNEEQNTEVLKGELKTLEETRDAVITTVGDQQSTALNNVNAQISTKQREINQATSNYNDHKARVKTSYEDPIKQINKECALETTDIFTTELRNELMTHIKPTDYVDEYMLVTESMTCPQRFEKAKELMNRAKSQLVKISSGKKTYSVDTRSFLFNKHFKYFSEQLCAGAIIYVETKKDIMEQLHLTGIDINFDDKSATLTLGNKYDRSDLKALYDEALGQNSKSFSELKYVTELVNKNAQQLTNFDSYIKSISTLTLNHVLTAEDESFEINNRGIWGRIRQYEEGVPKVDGNGNPLFDPEQIKLIHNGLYLTENNWETASTALGKIVVDTDENDKPVYKYGLIGDVVIGNLFLGKELHLFGGTKTQTKNGTEYSISLDQHGLTIVNDGTSAGIVIKDKQGNKKFYADEYGNLVLSGTIFATSGKIGGWTIDANSLKTSFANTNGTYSVYFNAPTTYGDSTAKGSLILGSKLYDGTKDWWLFHVSSDGSLYSTSLNVAGKCNIDAYDGFIYTDTNNYAGITKTTIVKIKSSKAINDGYLIENVDNADFYNFGIWNSNARLFGVSYDGGVWSRYIYANTLNLYSYVKDVFTPCLNIYKASGSSDIGIKILDGSSLRFLIGDNLNWSIGSFTDSGGIYDKALFANTDNYRVFLRSSGKSNNTAIGVKNNDTYTFSVDNSGSLLATGHLTLKKSDNTNLLEIYESSNDDCILKGYGNETIITNSSGTILAEFSNSTIALNTSNIDLNASNIDLNASNIALNAPNKKIWLQSDEVFVSDFGDTNASTLTIYGKLIAYTYTTDNGWLVSIETNRGGAAGGQLWGTWTLGSSTAVTSDINKKNSINDLQEKYNIFFNNLRPVSYKYNDGTSNRIHTGFIAQDVGYALEQAELTTQEFAGLVIDEEGNQFLRYEEFISLNTWHIQKAMARIAELENTVVELKTQLQTLTAD